MPPELTARLSTLGNIILFLVMVACLVLGIDDKTPLLIAGLIGFTALGAILK